jgi:hypothetical protein
MNKDEKPILMQAIQAIYKSCAEQGRVPYETDLVEWLNQEAVNNPKTKRGEVCEDLANRLSLYCRGAIFGKLFDGPTSIPLDCQLLVLILQTWLQTKLLKLLSLCLFRTSFCVAQPTTKKNRWQRASPLVLYFA